MLLPPKNNPLTTLAAPELSRRIEAALAATGARAVLSAGWSAALGGSGPRAGGSLLRTGYVPHDWLFPRCCAAIHHGGAGTTAAGLYAGIPAMAVPFFGDQARFMWGCVGWAVCLGARCRLRPFTHRPPPA
jgi:UDP:flavonoid glycosyltransferase YjiC (YdhE family)